MRKRNQQEAELDITSFMNLMIVLVPVLLMSMVFSHITVLDLKLPAQASSAASADDLKQKLELVIHQDVIDVNFPAGIRVKQIERLPDDPSRFDLKLLSDVLQEIKRQLKEKEIDKRDITILSQPDTDYQTLVSLMDTARSFKAVVAASVVDAELFPEISLGDAPVDEGTGSGKAGDQG